MPTSTDPAPPRRADVPGRGRLARGQHVSHQHGAAFRVLRALGVTAIVLAVVAAGGGVWAYHRLQGNIQSSDVSPLLGSDRPGAAAATDPTTGNSAVNILVMGSDTRDLSDGSGDEYGGEAADPGARSDTTVLVHLSADRRSARLVSIPRDSMVQLPDCTATDGSTTKAHLGIFNSAFSEGGAACTIRSVEALTQVRVDHYVVIDFSGFRSMIDALGGVTICTPEAISSKAANLYLSAGTHEDVNGETALAYARVRYGIGDGSDISRISRQQALMSSMVQKVTSSQILLRPDKLYSFLDAATKSVTTDPDLADLTTVAGLAQSLQKMPAGGVQFITVPNEEYPKNKARVQWTSAAATLWQEIRTDTGAGAAATASPTVDPATSSALTVAPAQISVQVLNVGAPAGTAGTAATALAAQGFTIAETGDGAPTASGTAVLVRYGSGRADSAATVAAAFPGATLKEDDGLGRTVVVELSAGAPTVVDVRPRVTSTTAPATPTPPNTARSATADLCS